MGQLCYGMGGTEDNGVGQLCYGVGGAAGSGWDSCVMGWGALRAVGGTAVLREGAVGPTVSPRCPPRAAVRGGPGER